MSRATRLKATGPCNSGFELPDHQGSQEDGGGEPQLSYPVTEKLPSLFGEAPSRWLPLSGAVGASDGEISPVT